MIDNKDGTVQISISRFKQLEKREATLFDLQEKGNNNLILVRRADWGQLLIPKKYTKKEFIEDTEKRYEFLEGIVNEKKVQLAKAETLLWEIYRELKWFSIGRFFGRKEKKKLIHKFAVRAGELHDEIKGERRTRRRLVL